MTALSKLSGSCVCPSCRLTGVLRTVPHGISPAHAEETMKRCGGHASVLPLLWGPKVCPACRPGLDCISIKFSRCLPAAHHLPAEIWLTRRRFWRVEGGVRESPPDSRAPARETQPGGGQPLDGRLDSGRDCHILVGGITSAQLGALTCLPASTALTICTRAGSLPT